MCNLLAAEIQMQRGVHVCQCNGSQLDHKVYKGCTGRPETAIKTLASICWYKTLQID